MIIKNSFTFLITMVKRLVFWHEANQLFENRLTDKIHFRILTVHLRVF